MERRRVEVARLSLNVWMEKKNGQPEEWGEKNKGKQGSSQLKLKLLMRIIILECAALEFAEPMQSIYLLSVSMQNWRAQRIRARDEFQ